MAQINKAFITCSLLLTFVAFAKAAAYFASPFSLKSKARLFHSEAYVFLSGASARLF